MSSVEAGIGQTLVLAQVQSLHRRQLLRHSRVQHMSTCNAAVNRSFHLKAQRMPRQAALRTTPHCIQIVSPKCSTRPRCVSRHSASARASLPKVLHMPFMLHQSCNAPSQCPAA